MSDFMDRTLHLGYPEGSAILFSITRRTTVSQEQNFRIAQQLLAGIGEGADPDEIGALFSVDVQFEIAGDVGALPWIGWRTGRSAASTSFVTRAV